VGHPIFFTTFGENANRDRIARQPISVGTLLETNATLSELITGTVVLSQIADNDERHMHQVIWPKERAGFLYDAQLTEYTAPVHLLSARTQTQDAMVSYHAGAALASVCLNLTENHFLQLRVPSSFAAFDQSRIDAFRSAKNRGFAFACIAFNAPQYSDASGVDEWLKAAISESGLPDVESINQSAYERFETIRRQLEVRWPLDRTRDYLLELGREIFVVRSQLGSVVPLSQLLEREIPLPPMFDSEGDILEIGRARLDKNRFDPEHMFNWEWELRKFIDNFLVGCRGTGH
jgi:hypothetical protein